MASFLLSYDLKNTTPSPYATFLAKSASLGWSAWIKGSTGVMYRMPNTTLIGSFPTMDAAEKAMNDPKLATQQAIGTAVTIEKFVIVEYVSARFNSDEKQSA
jgi:hypothetical protein